MPSLKSQLSYILLYLHDRMNNFNTIHILILHPSSARLRREKLPAESEPWTEAQARFLAASFVAFRRHVMLAGLLLI